MDARTATGARTANSRPLVAALLASFAFGAALAGYLVYTFKDRDAVTGPAEGSARLAARDTAMIAAGPSPSASASEAARAVAKVEMQHGGLDQRLAAAEQRIARLDLQAQAISGNTARAEGLLIAFASRRALEKGAELGYLGDQLRLRFGDAQPNAVKTIIAASRNPITLDQLVARLEGLGPKLADARDMPTMQRLSTELSQLFVIRRESAPSPQPQRRLERAKLFLDSGRAEAAIAEIRNLPGAAQAKTWIADATRYAQVQDALDRIETAAVLEPRMLRDSAGDKVEQPSPAQAE